MSALRRNAVSSTKAFLNSETKAFKFCNFSCCCAAFSSEMAFFAAVASKRSRFFCASCLQCMAVSCSDLANSAASRFWLEMSYSSKAFLFAVSCSSFAIATASRFSDDNLKLLPMFAFALLLLFMLLFAAAPFII